MGIDGQRGMPDREGVRAAPAGGAHDVTIQGVDMRTRTSRLRSRFVACGLLAASLTTVSADAVSELPAEFVIVGKAGLGSGLGAFGTGCFEGYAVGYHHGLVPPAEAPPLPDTNVSADFVYQNPLFTIGTAEGIIDIAGTEMDFQWERVGAVAIVLFSSSQHSGVGIAAFVPASASLTSGGPLPECELANGTVPPSYATIAGVAMLTG